MANEPDEHFSRMRLSSRWLLHRGCLAACPAVSSANSPAVAKKTFGRRGVLLPSLELFLDLVRVVDFYVAGLVDTQEPKRPLSIDRIRLETGVGLVARRHMDKRLRYWLEMRRVFERG